MKQGISFPSFQFLRDFWIESKRRGFEANPELAETRILPFSDGGTSSIFTFFFPLHLIHFLRSSSHGSEASINFHSTRSLISTWSYNEKRIILGLTLAVLCVREKITRRRVDESRRIKVETHRRTGFVEIYLLKSTLGTEAAAAAESCSIAFLPSLMKI